MRMNVVDINVCYTGVKFDVDRSIMVEVDAEEISMEIETPWCLTKDCCPFMNRSNFLFDVF